MVFQNFIWLAKDSLEAGTFLVLEELNKFAEINNADYNAQGSDI